MVQNLKGAVSISESLERTGVDLNNVIYITVLAACVQCQDLKAPEAGMIDVVSFNVLVKAHLRKGNFDKVRGLLEEMRGRSPHSDGRVERNLMNAVLKCERAHLANNG